MWIILTLVLNKKNMKEFNTFQDISDLLFKDITTIRKKMKGYTPALIGKTNLFYFSREQVELFIEELR